MVDAIQGVGQMMGAGMTPRMTALTDDQKKTIADILSKYDSKNVSTDDAKSIFEAFREAGIKPAKGMKEAIEAAGFNADDLRSKGLSDQTTLPLQSSSSSNSINLSALQSLQQILSQFDLTNLSDSDQTSLTQQLESNGFIYPGSVIDVKS
jgi:hypothetical protein